MWKRCLERRQIVSNQRLPTTVFRKGDEVRLQNQFSQNTVHVVEIWGCRSFPEEKLLAAPRFLVNEHQIILVLDNPQLCRASE